jgi:hypothetical protein
MQYIAESITPAGVSVFVGFWKNIDWGNMEDISDSPIMFHRIRTSMQPIYDLWGEPRWDFWNGWTEATRNFENEVGFDVSGTVEIINANDQNRHICKLEDNAYIATGLERDTGFFDLWTHPQDTMMRYGMESSSGSWMFYVEYNGSGFFDHFGNLLTLATPKSDYHLGIDFNSGAFDVYVMRDKVGSDISYLGAETTGEIFKVESIGTGSGFVDSIGLSSDLDYDREDNWQRLYPTGWGIDNVDEISGITDLYNSYFTKEKFFVT